MAYAWQQFPVGIHETGEIFRNQVTLAKELNCSTALVCSALTGKKRIEGLTLYKIKDKKFCGSCKEIKDVAKFRRRTWKNDLGDREGCTSQCKHCLSEIQRARDKANPEKTARRRRKASIKGLYNLSENEYDAMLFAQGYKCAICRVTFTKRPHIDHDHTTSELRGLLCHHCNTGIGLFRDTAELLQNAINYLERVT